MGAQTAEEPVVGCLDVCARADLKVSNHLIYVPKFAVIARSVNTNVESREVEEDVLPINKKELCSFI